MKVIVEREKTPSPVCGRQREGDSESESVVCGVSDVLTVL